MQPLAIASIGSPEQRAATEILRKYSDQDLTIADAAGLYLMAERHIQACWSTDFHLGLTGVPLVASNLNRDTFLRFKVQKIMQNLESWA